MFRNDTSWTYWNWFLRSILECRLSVIFWLKRNRWLPGERCASVIQSTLDLGVQWCLISIAPLFSTKSSISLNRSGFRNTVCHTVNSTLLQPFLPQLGYHLIRMKVLSCTRETNKQNVSPWRLWLLTTWNQSQISMMNEYQMVQCNGFLSNPIREEPISQIKDVFK